MGIGPITLLLLLGALAQPQAQPPDEPVVKAAADASSPSPAAEPLSPQFVAWLAEVDPLISRKERQVFLSLKRNHQREAFIRRFWRERDPYPETARNELRERFDERIFLVQTEYGGLDDDRARILLVHGPPQTTLEVRCSKTRIPVVVWAYSRSDYLDFGFILVFYRNRGLGPARLWRPSYGPLENLVRNARGCINGVRLGGVVRSIQATRNYDYILAQVVAKPKPRSEEWVSSFASYTAEVPEAARRFEAEVAYDFLGRHQSRTLVQGTILVPIESAQIGEFAGYRSYDFQLTGEVVIDNQLFESFRYKFGFPAEGSDLEAIPLAFQRLLRPGSYRLLLKLQDLNSKAFFSDERTLEVPDQTELAVVRNDQDSESMALFREATEAVGSDRTAIRIVPPLGELHSGQLRFDTLVSGSEITSVGFILDEKPILVKNRPPYNVEIDLGPFPRLRTLRVEARDRNDRVVAEDELLLNAGEHRFAVRLIEPRQGRTYEESLQARVQIEVPPDLTLERVEIFLNEQLIATLYQPPFIQPIRLPQNQEISYVRAVAHLVDGNSTEDLVFVNSPDFLEEIGVQFVELFAAVLDSEGHMIPNLTKNQFRVFEDGVEQEILRFEKVDDLPIHTVILIDSSASMVGALDRARKAALQYFQQAVEKRDRAAVITFNRFPNLAVKFTNDHNDLGAALQGLTAEGQTALYDSVMFSLYYFSGIKGQRAMLLLSDGKDEVSRFGYDEMLEYARRAGVTIYSIGFKVREAGARRHLIELARETGGRSYFINNIDTLPAIYSLVEEDLRSQYLIAYQSKNTILDEKFRSIELKVKRSKTTVRTLSGYYP